MRTLTEQLAEQVEELKEQVENLKNELGDKELELLSYKIDIKQLYDFLVQHGNGWIEVNTILNKFKELELL